VANIRFDDDLTFTAVKWDLHEASLVSIPADSLSGIRSLGSGDRAMAFTNIAAIRVRMQVRQRMHERQSAYFGEFQ
jgi:hypothetical protein